MLERVCLVDKHLPPGICSNLKAHPEQQVEVQREANLIHTTATALSSLPGLLLCLFLGPWSDANGRKPLLFMPLLGSVVSYLYLVLYAAWPDLGGWWYMGSSVYAFIGGGTVVFFTGVFSYITDITTRENRTIRVAFLDFGIFSGFPVGVMAGGIIYEPVGYIGLFAIAGAIAAVCLTYVVIFFTFLHKAKISQI